LGGRVGKSGVVRPKATLDLVEGVLVGVAVLSEDADESVGVESGVVGGSRYCAKGSKSARNSLSRLPCC
jgi:hypothetical protein